MFRIAGRYIFLFNILVILFMTAVSVSATDIVSVLGWGNDTYGQCTVPTPNSGFSSVVAGDSLCMGLKTDGSIVVWGGSEDYGQWTVPTPNSGFTAIAVGVSHCLGCKTNGSIVAWGNNDSGQCDVPTPNSGFTAVAGGLFHSLGLKTDGSIVAWGDDGNGQCDVPTPNSGFTSIAAGIHHSLGLKSDGSIVAWGDDGNGQCDVPYPNSGFTAVAAGPDYSMGLKTDGSIVAWGHNDSGQCNVPTPNSGFTAIAAGGCHGLGLKSDGSIIAWGENGCGQCTVPTSNTRFLAIAAGYSFSLGLKQYSSPNAPVLTGNIVYVSGVPRLHATWTESVDADSDVIGYEYAVGTTSTDPGTGYLKNWTSTGLGREVTVSDLDLTDGQTYYIYVKAKDGTNLYSNAGISNAIGYRSDITDLYSMTGGTYNLPDGTYVVLEKKTVTIGTNKLQGAMYIQESAGTTPQAGIKVVTSQSTKERMQVTITGTLHTDSGTGERYIDAATVDIILVYVPLPVERVSSNTDVAAAKGRRIIVGGVIVSQSSNGYTLDNGVEITKSGLINPTEFDADVSLNAFASFVGVAVPQSGGTLVSLLPTDASTAGHCQATIDPDPPSMQGVDGLSFSQSQNIEGSGGGVFLIESVSTASWINSNNFAHPESFFTEPDDSNLTPPITTIQRILPGGPATPFWADGVHFYYLHHDPDDDPGVPPNGGSCVNKTACSFNTTYWKNGIYMMNAVMKGYNDHTDCFPLTIDNLIISRSGTSIEPYVLKWDGTNNAELKISISDACLDYGVTITDDLSSTMIDNGTRVSVYVYKLPRSQNDDPVATITQITTGDWASMEWNGKNGDGETLSRGIYAYEVNAYHFEYGFSDKDGGVGGYKSDGTPNWEKSSSSIEGYDEDSYLSSTLDVTGVTVANITRPVTGGVTASVQYTLSGTNFSDVKLHIIDSDLDEVGYTNGLTTNLGNNTYKVDVTFNGQAGDTYWFVVTAFDSDSAADKGDRNQPTSANAACWSNIQIDAFGPGTIGNPGAIVSASMKADPNALATRDNNDYDDGGSEPDNSDLVIGANDNDIVKVTLHGLKNIHSGTMTFSVSPQQWSSQNMFGSIRVFKSNGAALLTDYTVDLASPTGDLAGLANGGTVDLYIEGMNICDDITLSLSYMPDFNSIYSSGSDGAHMKVF